jgi:hypothetical protein
LEPLAGHADSISWSACEIGSYYWTLSDSSNSKKIRFVSPLLAAVLISFLIGVAFHT